DSGDGGQERQVVEASRIVLSFVDGDVGDHGGQSVESERRPIEAIEIPPRALCSQGHNSEDGNENDMPKGIYGIEMETINTILVHNEPVGNDPHGIAIKPVDQQKRKVKKTKNAKTTVKLGLRLNGN